MGEVEITYSIRLDGTEVGFGSSGTWDSIEAAAHAVNTDLQRRSWETARGMPSPDEVSEFGRPSDG